MAKQGIKKNRTPSLERPGESTPQPSAVAPTPNVGAGWLISICSLVCVVSIALAIYWQQAAEENAQTLAKAEANVLLLLQQHEAISKAYLSKPNQRDETAIKQLRTWVGFDEQFISKNLTNESVRYEVAQIAMRQAQIQLHLSNRVKAKRNLDIAQQQLELLLETYLGSIHYSTDLGVMWILRAVLLAGEGKPQEAEAACRRAVEIASAIEERAMVESTDGSRSVQNELVDLLMQLGQPELAKLVATQNVQQLEQLAQLKPDSWNLGPRLESARSKLKKVAGG